MLVSFATPPCHSIYSRTVLVSLEHCTETSRTILTLEPSNGVCTLPCTDSHTNSYTDSMQKGYTGTNTNGDGQLQ